MRFLTLELDGRSTLDRAQQRLYGVVLGQMTLAPAGGGTLRSSRQVPAPERNPALRRWFRSTLESFRRPR